MVRFEVGAITPELLQAGEILERQLVQGAAEVLTRRIQPRVILF